MRGGGGPCARMPDVLLHRRARRFHLAARLLELFQRELGIRLRIPGIPDYELEVVPRWQGRGVRRAAARVAAAGRKLINVGGAAEGLEVEVRSRCAALLDAGACLVPVCLAHRQAGFAPHAWDWAARTRVEGEPEGGEVAARQLAAAGLAVSHQLGAVVQPGLHRLAAGALRQPAALVPQRVVAQAVAEHVVDVRRALPAVILRHFGPAVRQCSPLVRAHPARIGAGWRRGKSRADAADVARRVAELHAPARSPVAHHMRQRRQQLVVGGPAPCILFLRRPVRRGAQRGGAVGFSQIAARRNEPGPELDRVVVPVLRPGVVPGAATHGAGVRITPRVEVQGLSVRKQQTAERGVAPSRQLTSRCRGGNLWGEGSRRCGGLPRPLQRGDRSVALLWPAVEPALRGACHCGWHQAAP